MDATGHVPVFHVFLEMMPLWASFFAKVPILISKILNWRERCRILGTMQQLFDSNLLSDPNDIASCELPSREMLPQYYRELRLLARAYLRQERRDHTLQATALVHEAFLRLTKCDEHGYLWKNKRHFFAAASEAMRRILIESVRRRHARKRGGTLHRVELSDIDDRTKSPGAPRDEKLLAIDRALGDLQRMDPLKAELVKLRFFVGMSQAEAAECLGMSKRTADRHWAYARAWLLVRTESYGYAE